MVQLAPIMALLLRTPENHLWLKGGVMFLKIHFLTPNIFHLIKVFFGSQKYANAANGYRQKVCRLCKSLLPIPLFWVCNITSPTFTMHQIPVFIYVRQFHTFIYLFLVYISPIILISFNVFRSWTQIIYETHNQHFFILTHLKKKEKSLNSKYQRTASKTQ